MIGPAHCLHRLHQLRDRRIISLSVLFIIMRAQKIKSRLLIVVLCGCAAAISAVSAMATVPGAGLLG
jgi:hypothetical protein